jgi:hypothetical protein
MALVNLADTLLRELIVEELAFSRERSRGDLEGSRGCWQMSVVRGPESRGQSGVIGRRTRLVLLSAEATRVLRPANR